MRKNFNFNLYYIDINWNVSQYNVSECQHLAYHPTPPPPLPRLCNIWTAPYQCPLNSQSSIFNWRKSWGSSLIGWWLSLSKYVLTYNFLTIFVLKIRFVLQSETVKVLSSILDRFEFHHSLMLKFYSLFLSF